MASASGTTVIGTQLLVYDPDGLTRVAVLIEGGFPVQARYVGYVSIEVFNGLNSYQVVGMPIWYEGVLLAVPSYASGLPYSVVATWRVPDLQWQVSTF